MGSTELELNAQPGNVQLVDNKGQRYTADDAEEMIGKLTGMPIPLNSLRQWILGLPGDATDYKLDDQYRLSEITYSQNGKNWKVVYGGYHQSFLKNKNTQQCTRDAQHHINQIMVSRIDSRPPDTDHNHRKQRYQPLFAAVHNRVGQSHHHIGGMGTAANTLAFLP